MTDSNPDVQLRLADLDTRVRALEAVQEVMLRLMATTKPVDRVLEQYGATETQEQAFHKLLDDLVTRIAGPAENQPTFGYFQLQLEHIFPALRHDRTFTQLLIDTLKVERPVYRTLYAYAAAHHWPTWTS
jgi:hypothetical protein